MRPRAAVFCLHDIVPDARLPEVAPTHRPYALSPAEFRAHLMAAHALDLRSITTGQIPSDLGGSFFCLTFDDGCASDYGEAFPALAEFGLRATFFVVPTLVGTSGHVTWAQLREMAAAGMEIGSHSLTHPFLHELDAAGIRHEFGESKRILEDRLGSPVRSASLPRGWEPPHCELVLAELGYRAFCTSRVGWWRPGDRPLAIPRVAVRRGMESEDFAAIAAAAPRALWLLQAVEAAKNAAKVCLGHAGWQRLRAPLLALRGALVIAELSFFGALAVIAWVYLGYPVVLGIVATLRRRPVGRRPVEPSVSLVICAYNEERDLRRKLEETLGCDYPADRLEVIVASDGSTDRTDDIVREFEGTSAPRVRLLRVEGRGGKTVAQNAAVRAATGEILVFSDVTTVYTRGTIRAMVANFADPRVGCVGGDLQYEKDPHNPSAQGRALFWSYERQLRVWESQVHSIVGVAGCVYAMRRALYEPLDPGAISDFVQPGRITERGWRTVLEPAALAFEPVESHTLGEELNRRARVITRGLRGAFRMPALLNPLRHPWFATLLWSHRVLRWLVPVFLLVLLAASAALATRGGVYALALASQVTVYGAGVIAFALERARVRVPGAFIPLYFCVVNLAPLLALAWLARGERKVVWETGR